MPQNYGKKFEQKVKEDFKKIGGSFVYRLPDNMAGFKGISGVSDFICYVEPNIFLLEVKSTSGNTFPLANLTQLEKLLQYKDIPGLRKGVVIWYTEKDTVIYVPAISFEKMKLDGKKSINIRTLETDGYDYIKIPSVKKRVFLDSDYSVLLNLPENW